MKCEKVAIIADEFGRNAKHSHFNFQVYMGCILQCRGGHTAKPSAQYFFEIMSKSSTIVTEEVLLCCPTKRFNLRTIVPGIKGSSCLEELVFDSVNWLTFL